ncbi:hypothetical protein ACP70R_005903 [Stipagrostis hirtigluma subsp. patula]
MAVECSRHHDLEKILQGESAEPCNLPLQMLQDITNNFSEEQVLGRGGFGVVYKGVLQNGQVIAVKKVLFLPGKQEKQFENELTKLMRLKNKNIVRLVGYCYNITKILVEIEGKYHFADMAEMLLCLEFVPEGSLEKHISDEWCGLDWQTRCKIIVGICHGLHYLHDNGIIHLDLKPANILLDYDMVPKITDFGLSRLLEQSRIYTNTRAGTMGYMAPEYLNRGEISIKSDIFSAGVVIIEIIVGHRTYPDSGTPTQDFVEHVLQNWRKRLVEQKCTSLEKDSQQIKVCIEIGLRCVHTDPAKRPTTRKIIECLDRWESMNLHVSNEEWTRIDTVHQKHANTPKAALSTPSPGKKSQMKRRSSETDPDCMEMDPVKRPATTVSIERLNELRLSADQPMVATEMRYRPRHVNDDHQREWVDNRHHGPRRAPSAAATSGRGKGAKGLGKGGAKRHRKVLRDAVTYTEHACRKTVTAMDVVYALKRQGRTLYGFGG